MSKNFMLKKDQREDCVGVVLKNYERWGRSPCLATRCFSEVEFMYHVRHLMNELIAIEQQGVQFFRQSR